MKAHEHQLALISRIERASDYNLPTLHQHVTSLRECEEGRCEVPGCENHRKETASVYTVNRDGMRL